MSRWFAIIPFVGLVAAAQPPQGVWVQLADDGRLLYQRDALGNRLPDFGRCGYKAGMEAIPDAPVRVTVNPAAGDDRAAIQAAINQVAALTPDANGIRGAVLLAPGEFQLSSGLSLSAGGVVLRGSGNADTGTVLRATGTSQYSLISISGSGSRSIVSGTTRNITDTYVPVGARSFTVDSTNGLAVGHTVQVFRPCTTNWVHDIGMDQLCCPPDSYPWTDGDRDIYWDRTIVRMEGNRITIDAPISTAIEAKYGGGTIRRYTWSGRIEKCGVEYLKGLSNYTNSTDEAHAWTFIGANRAQNCWVRRVTSQYFGYSCVTLSDVKWVSVLDSESLDPISIIDGGRRYAFNLNSAQLCLVRGCYNRKDRHQYVTGSDTPGPNAFVDSSSDTAYSDAGPHHRWASGILWDRIVVNGNNLNMQNRGNLGTGHGWAGGNCVAWNCDADGGFTVQKPPTAFNWLIGSVGTIENGTVYVGPHDAGNYDHHGSNVFPSTLHGNQRRDAQETAGLQVREYLAGDFDAFAGAGATGDVVYVDPAWRTNVDAATALPLRNFDHVTNGGWVVWTHTNRLDGGDRIVSGTLYFGVRGLVANAKTNVVYLDALTNGFALSNFVASVSTSGTTVVRIDLADRLATLADGRLNLAAQPNVAVDWSLLELRVEPPLTNVSILTLNPVADTYVRDGSFGGQNFGTQATLAVKQSAPADGYNRHALLKWDLGPVTGRILHAKIRLMPSSLGTNFLEHIAAVAGNGWTETGITWSNQPATGRRLVSWNPQPSSPVEFPVTAEAATALQDDGFLSVKVSCINDPNGLGLMDYAARENASVSNRPQLVLTLAYAPNTWPTISDVTNRVIAEDTATPAIPFIIGDAETDPADLDVAGSSSNPTLLPNAGIDLGGTGATRTVTLTPAANQSGTATVSLVVNDGSLTATDKFTLVVSPINDPPILTAFADRTLAPGSTTGAMAFQIEDIETAVTALTVSVTSSDPLLVPAGSIAISSTTNPWTSTDIGVVGTAGDSTPGDIATVAASGADFWNASDEGHFLCQPMTNDGELVARVRDLTPTHPWAKAGAMFRANANPDSAYAFMLVSPSNGVSFQRRKIAGDSAVSSTSSGIVAPCWVRLVRWGTTNVAGYYAVDAAGTRGPWIQVGSNDTVQLTPTCLEGLAGTSHNDGLLSTSHYDRISGPAQVGGNRSLLVTPAPDRFGQTVITIVLGDGATAVTQSFNLVVSPAGRSLRWSATTAASWDFPSTNWLDTGNGAATVFRPGDQVLFDNSGAASNDVSLATNLMPLAFVVNASSNYALGGAGRIIGNTSLQKGGTGLLTLGGTSNDYSGPVLVTGGTLKVSSASALGATNGATTIGNGATLDVNGQNLGREPVVLATGGTLANNGAAQINALQYLALSGAASVGGTGRLDIRSGTGASLNLNGFTLTKSGTNQFSLVAAVATNAGDFVVNNGILSIETTSVVGGTGSIQVNPAGTVQYFQSPTVTKTNQLRGGRLLCAAAGSIGPPIVLVSNSVIDARNPLELTNGISGPAGFVKSGTGTLTLAAANTYAGLTSVSNGILTLAPGGIVAGSGIVVAAGATLDGVGLVRGSVTIQAGGSLAPGSGIGTLTVTNSVSLAGTFRVELNKSANTGDLLIARSVQLGGTLVVTNLGGSWAAGDSFRILAASNCAGAFAAIQPPQPAVGLAWNPATLASNGTLGIVRAAPTVASLASTSNRMQWSGTNGSPGANYFVRAGTNLLMPPASWPIIVTNVFDATGRFVFTNALATNRPQQFFLLQLP